MPKSRIQIREVRSNAPPSPPTNRAACQGRPVRKIDFNTTADHNTETAPNLQARRLISKFGFAFETAVVVAALTWGIAR